MNARVARVGCAVAMLLLAVLAACSSDRSTDLSSTARAANVERAVPPPVSLPDISSLETIVQEQIRGQYAALEQIRADATASAVDRGNAYGEVGKLLMAVDSLDAAEPFYLNAQALAPGDHRWPYYLGQLYKSKGNLEKSKASFERVLELRPDDVATLIWLGEEHLGDGRPEAAEPLFRKVLSLQPKSVPALYGLGRAALARDDYGAAVQELEQALALDRTAASIHYPLAMAYRGLGDTSKADGHFRRRANSELAPPDPLMQELKELLQNATSYELRGTRALSARDWTAAVGYFRKGLELAPQNPSLRHKLGTALFLMGDARGAQTHFEQVIRSSPEYAKAYYSLGVLLETNGRNQEAAERYSAALKHDPDYAEARVRLAGLLRRSGRVQDSLSQYRRVLDADPTIPEASFGYAMALVRLRRYREALDTLNAGAAANPGQVGFAHARARLLAAAPDDQVRDGRQAMAVMQALPDDQRRVDLGETMAMALAEIGQYEEAASWQRAAIEGAQRAGQPALAKRMAESLALYNARKPCRTPWRDVDLP